MYAHQRTVHRDLNFASPWSSQSPSYPSPTTAFMEAADEAVSSSSSGQTLIGHPIHFALGQFSGKTVRARLDEIQKADLGRKYARVDRRPLDPPPAVLLRLYTSNNPGREEEVEIHDYDQVESLGLICSVDLFPVPSSESRRQGEEYSRRNYQIPSGSPRSLLHSPPYSSIGRYPHTFSDSGRSGSSLDRESNYRSALSFSIPRSHLRPYKSSTVVHHIGGYPLTEGSKLTQALVGQTFVQPSLVDYQGKKSLVFAFADLACKLEGTFILRYRVFDLFSRAVGQQDLTVQAECYGGVFKVYSTKEFPGLKPSTELTKQLARFGFRLNIRETERKRRKKPDRLVEEARES